jgi:NAD+ synthase
VQIALAQINPTVGDIAGNVSKIKAIWQKACAAGVDLVVLSELAVSGYPPEDFATNAGLLKAVADGVASLARFTASGPALLVGAPWKEDGKIYNAALLLEGGAIAAKVFKHDLPNYGSFDEKRVFTQAPLQQPVDWRGLRLGVMICEDMWNADAAQFLAESGAQILVVLNGSPFETGKQRQRYALARDRASETGLPLVYLNQTGGQDEMVFDGASFVTDSQGALIAQA